MPAGLPGLPAGLHGHGLHQSLAGGEGEVVGGGGVHGEPGHVGRGPLEVRRQVPVVREPPHDGRPAPRRQGGAAARHQPEEQEQAADGRRTHQGRQGHRLQPRTLHPGHASLKRVMVQRKVDNPTKNEHSLQRTKSE